MTTQTYRYRRTAPVSATQLTKRGSATAVVTASANSQIVDITNDDATAALADLDEYMSGMGYARIATNPSGTPTTEFRMADGSFATLGTPTTGQYLQLSGSTIVGGTGGGSSFDARDQLINEHFATGNNNSDSLGTHGWRVDATGTGNAQNITGEAGHPGILTLLSGTSGTARSAIDLGNLTLLNILPGGSNPIVFECLIRWVTSTSTLAMLRTQCGLGSGWALANPNPLSDGIFFRLEPLLLSGAVAGVCRNGGTETSTSLSLTPTLNSWYRIGFTYTPGGTPSVQFKVNGANAGSAITTNIPAGALGAGFRIDSQGLAGTNPGIGIDYVTLTQVTNKET